MGALPSITDVPGVLVGHAHDEDALTGCTVVLAMKGAVAGVDVRGSAPGTRETDLMRPANLVERVHAVVLTGGSAYGLDAACGVMGFLEEHGAGFDMGFCVVPIVAGAVIFDLDVGNPRVRPDRKMGYAACASASSAPPEEGNAGAGLGATVGKMHGPDHAMKGGVGTWAAAIPASADGWREGGSGRLPGGGAVLVGAIVVVNSLGDVVDPGSGMTIAGAFDRESRTFMRARACPGGPGPEPGPGPGSVNAASAPLGPTQGARPMGNTTLAVVATNARLDKEGANKVAQMAHDGLARAIHPVHTMYDGDVVFALSTGDGVLTGDRAADITAIGAAAADVVAAAIVRAVKAARAVAGIPSAREAGTL